MKKEDKQKSKGAPEVSPPGGGDIQPLSMGDINVYVNYQSGGGCADGAEVSFYQGAILKARDHADCASDPHCIIGVQSGDYRCEAVLGGLRDTITRYLSDGVTLNFSIR